MGVKPQSIQSRLNAAEFKVASQLEINNVLGRRVFDVDMPETLIEGKGHIPVLDIRISDGIGLDLFDTDKQRVLERVTIEGLRNCVGLYVFGDSMSPEYRAGDIIFVHSVNLDDDLDYGQPYLVVTQSERILRCLYRSNDNSIIRLVSLNNSTNSQGDRLFPDKEISKDKIVYIYKVVGLFRRLQL